MKHTVRTALSVVSLVAAVLLPTRSVDAQAAAAPGPATTRIGGLDALTVRRTPVENLPGPQFLSMTLLPGRALNLFQATAYFPGRGEFSLLQSPSLAEAARRMDNPETDPRGYVSYSLGGAFLLPWASRLSGQVSPDGKTVTTQWHGRPLALRINSSGKYAIHGLIHKLQAEDIKTQAGPDKTTVTAVLHAGDFGGRWLSRTDVYFTFVLSAAALDITLVATNVGHEPEPMAIGWHPYFALPGGDRTQARLHLSASQYAETTPPDGLTTGVLSPVAGTPFDFLNPQGTPFRDSINANFSSFTSGSACPAALSDLKSGYGLCVRPLSKSIKTIQVYSPKDGTFVAIEPQFNFPDPLGPEWHGLDTGFQTLNPGQSAEWHVRLELFTPAQAPAVAPGADGLKTSSSN